MATAAAIYRPYPRVGPALLGNYEQRRPNAYRRGYGGRRRERERRQVLLESDYICCICGTLCQPKAEDRRLWPHVDHIVPMSQGGSDTRDNKQCTCGSCNARKARQQDGRGGAK